LIGVAPVGHSGEASLATFFIPSLARERPFNDGLLIDTDRPATWSGHAPGRALFEQGDAPQPAAVSWDDVTHGTGVAPKAAAGFLVL
jgi:hypothetical protein